MISFISSWTQGIIVSVIIASIIEMILPDGNCQKYVKVVIGVFILFSIVSPVINKFTKKEINISSIVDVEKYSDAKQVSSTNLEVNTNLNIKQMYETNLKVDIKSKIESKGFKVKDITINTSDDEYKIEKIDIGIMGEINEESEVKNNKKSKNNVIGIVDSIEKISVDISSKVSKEEKRNVIDKVYSTYVDHNIVNFIKLVVDKDRATQLLNIYTSFIQMCEEDLGIQHATVLSARKLSQEDMNTIGNTLVSKTNKRIILENVVDPSIIAGIKVTVGNTVTDVTMKTKIDRMRNTLLKGGQMA